MISTRRYGFNKTPNSPEVVFHRLFFGFGVGVGIRSGSCVRRLFFGLGVGVGIRVRFCICCLLVTLPTSSIGMLAACIWLANCCHPTGSDVFRFRSRSWTRSTMLLPGTTTPSCSNSPLSFHIIFFNRDTN